MCRVPVITAVACIFSGCFHLQLTNIHLLVVHFGRLMIAQSERGSYFLLRHLCGLNGKMGVRFFHFAMKMDLHLHDDFVEKNSSKRIFDFYMETLTVYVEESV